MDKNIKSERTLIVVLLLFSLAMLGLAGLFFYRSQMDEAMIDIVIAAVLLFVCGYAVIVFVSKLAKQCFYGKIEKLIEKKGMRTIAEIKEVVKKSDQDILKAIEYLRENNYLDEFFVSGGVILNVREETERRRRYEEQKKEITLQWLQSQKEIAQNQKKIVEDMNKEVSELCESCGAVVKFKGNRGVCPYCGSPVKKR